MNDTSGQVKKIRGGMRNKIRLSKRDLIDLELVRRRVDASTMGDDPQELFCMLTPIEREFVLSTLDRVIRENSDG